MISVGHWNAPGPEAVGAFVPAVGNGRVLITSRNALWPAGQGLEVPVLDLEVAADFVAARTGDTDRQAAAALAEAVGGPPLALEQAAAYAQATGSSLAAYLALFHKRRADLLDRGQLRSACTKAVIVATALVPGAVLTSVVRISVMSASLPGVREPILRERPALAALLVELA